MLVDNFEFTNLKGIGVPIHVYWSPRECNHRMNTPIQLSSCRASNLVPCLAAAAILVGVLSTMGCAARGMKAAMPNIPVSVGWSSTAQDVNTTSVGDISRWWQRLGDPTLSSLVDQTLTGSRDLRAAQSRLREARAQRALASANRFPTTSASISSSGSKTSGSPTTNLFNPQFDATWEPDIFGASRRALEAASADASVTEEDLHNTQVSLVAEVASDYVSLRASQSRIQIARQNEASQSETLQLTQWRERAGLVSRVDVEQARTNLEQTRAGIPPLETSVAQSEHQLATLLGLTPGALEPQVAVATPIPSVPDEVAVGIPVDALRQRPDVREAEHKILAEIARLRQAKDAQYPSFTLTASLTLEQIAGASMGFVTGGASTLTGALTNGTSTAASFGGSVVQTLFDRGRIRQQIEIQSAVQEQAVIAYESTVLTAVQECEDALVSLAKSRDQLASFNIAAESARNAALLAKNRYNAGLADFQTVLDTERTVLSIEDSVAQTQADHTTAIIQLYKALGGGWSPAIPIANNSAVRSHS
jgi:multidrug efflux system outer membrane protein